MLGRVAVVRTDISEKINASIIRVTRIGELATTLAITSNRSTQRINSPSSLILVTLMMEALHSAENIPEDGILHTHRRENLKSYT
jgi:hypothetical protein